MIALLRHWKLIVGVLAIIASFGAGWRINGLRCDAKIAAIERAAEKARARQQANVEKAASDYESERTYANEATTIRAREIRTKYVPVPGTCDPGADVGRLLDDALEAANGGAPLKSGAAVPDASAEADPVR